MVEGEQDQAEALLRSYPYLAGQKGIIVDLSKREFKDITAFQYAVWALDWHMWQMLLKHMPIETAAFQLIELEKNQTEYGENFSLSSLLSALDTYVKHHTSWSSSQATDHWCQKMGVEQRLLPVHVVNEYCHPTRGFHPDMKFDETELRRSRRCGTGE